MKYSWKSIGKSLPQVKCLYKNSERKLCMTIFEGNGHEFRLKRVHNLSYT